MARILIVDDEPAIAMAVRDELDFEGLEVDTVSDGPAAFERVVEWHPDVVLLDVMLPGMNGFEVCRRLRAEGADVWIIMLTAREHEVDRVRGLEQGADDYVTKPFSLRELVARVKVGLRRREQAVEHPVLSFGNIRIDLPAHRVYQSGREIDLTPTEFGILKLLVERHGQVVSRDDFLEIVWGSDVYVTPRVVDTHVASLRKKIEGDDAVFLHSIRGVGYRLDATPMES